MLSALALVALLVGGRPGPLEAQEPIRPGVEGTLVGAVLDEGGPVYAAHVRLLDRASATVREADTNEAGRFLLNRLAPGQYTLEVTRLGYASLSRLVSIRAGQTTSVEVVLQPAALAVEGIEVEAGRSRERVRFEELAGVSVRELDNEQLKLVPGVGEADPIRAIEVLPGVVSTSDFSSSFNVRGGSADQNLILLDGVPIFSPFHLGGFFSVFNGDMVERAELQSGGFGAEHGDRVSSVLTIESDPGDGEFAVDGGVSLLAARVAVGGGMEGVDDALGLKRTRWRVSGRRSYFDQLLRFSVDFPYHLTDLQGVLETGFTSRDRLRITAYTGRDVLNLTRLDPEDFPLRIQWDWGNDLAGLTWDWDLGGADLTLRASDTRYGSGLFFPDFGDTEFSTSVRQRRGSVDLGFRPFRGLEVQLGTSLDRRSYDNLAESGGTVFGQGDGQGYLTGAFLQTRWGFPASWLVEAGVRVDRWAPDEGRAVQEVSPRLAAKRFFGGGRWAVKAAAGRYTQFLHSIRDEELPLGLDVWVLAGPRAPHVVSDQVQAGIETFPAEGWTVSLEGYRRTFDGVVAFNQADNPNFNTDDFLRGTGLSWGADLFVRRDGPGTSGWISLSYLRADRTFPDILSPAQPLPNVTFSPIFDRRIDLDLVLRFPALRGWQGGLRFNLGTGTPYTPVTGSYAYYVPNVLEAGGRFTWSGGQDPTDEEDEDEGSGFGVILGERNGARYPTYHRVDVSFRRTFEKSWGRITPHVDILNVYNQRNVLFYFFEYQRDPAVRSGISMFPFLPTVGVEINF